MTLSTRAGCDNIDICRFLLGIASEFFEISRWAQMAAFLLDFEDLWLTKKKDQVVLSAKSIDMYIQTEDKRITHKFKLEEFI